MRKRCAIALWLAAAICPVQAEEGYWKLAGAVEFWNPRVPPNGPATRSGGGWDANYFVQEGKVTYRVMSNFNPRNQVTIAMEATWQAPPAAIYPGEVIPVRARASVVEARGEGLGRGVDPWVQCVIAVKKVDQKGEGWGAPLVNLFSGPNSGGARGMAGAYKDYVNTTEFFGQKGGNFAATREIYLLFQTGHGFHHSETVKAAYRYQWVSAPASGGPSLGRIWQVRDEAWAGVWTRRGTSNVFDAVWTKAGLRLTALMNITISGNQVTVQRTQSSNGDVCTYNGTLAADGKSVTGMVKCYGGGGSLTRWSATIME